MQNVSFDANLVRYDSTTFDVLEARPLTITLTVPDGGTLFSYAILFEPPNGLPIVDTTLQISAVVDENGTSFGIPELEVFGEVTHPNGSSVVLGLGYEDGNETTELTLCLSGDALPPVDMSIDLSTNGIGSRAPAPFGPNTTIDLSMLGHGAASGTATEGDDLLSGGDGDDLISGLGGNDTISDGLGNDTLRGGLGDDVFINQGGTDIFDGGEGRDRLVTNLGGLETENTLLVDLADGIHGRDEDPGKDQLIGIEEFQATNVGMWSVQATGSANADLFLIEGGVANRLDGGAGNDTLQSGDGADTLIGGGGDDSIVGGATDADLRDVVFGGDGNDTIEGGAGNDELRGDAGNDDIAGGAGADTVIGGAGDDVMTGSNFGDVIFGGDGFDFINGGFGSDRLNGGNDADRFFHVGVAGHGSDWIQDYDASEGDVLLYGGSATVDQFQVNRANTANAGDASVDEAFVIYKPTGQILWALVDGFGNDAINIRIGGQDFDLLG